MKLELIGAVSVGGILLKVLGKVDNHDCREGTFLHASSATNAERFTDVGNGRGA